jgi:hypothetical protein
MPRASAVGVTYEAVKLAALSLPEVEESTSYGTPALKVRGKLMVRLREDGQTIVVRASWEDRERLMAIDAETYYVTDHYLKYPWVLARLATLKRRALTPLMRLAWQHAAPKSLVAKLGA